MSMRRSLVGAVSSVALVVALVAGCAGPAGIDVATSPAGPYVLVLGTAQDGGLPQIGCTSECCAAARRDPARARRVTSLLLVDPASGKRWLFDASPQLPAQVALAEGHGGPDNNATGRPPLFDGIFITHAHLGHYAGLAFLGREAYGSAPTPVHGTPRLLDYLAENGPWSLLVSAGHLVPTPFTPGEALALTDELSVTPLLVPHRDEFSDTVGFVIRGPGASLLYLPDIDKWGQWGTPVEEVIASVDHALLDGTFFGPDELPGRAMAEVPHPFIVESMGRFAALPAAERAKVCFTHLNHSNPVARSGSPEARAVAAAGFGVLEDGDVIPLAAPQVGR